MTIDAVDDLSPSVQYVAQAAQDEFDYDFPIYEEGDLVVDVDGVTQALGTDYTVENEGNEEGGTITFITPLTGGEIVTIYRDLPIARTSDFQQNGPIRSAAFNEELNRLIMMMQQLEASQGRSLRLSKVANVASSALELSPLANWLSKYVFINANGIPEPGDFDGSGTPISQTVIGALLYPLSTSESNAGVAVVNGYLPYGRVNRYGTNSTPGTTDMRPAIQAAFDSGHDVTFEAEQIYAVSDSQVTVNISGTQYPYATLARSGMRVDGRGATIKLLNAPNATPIMLYQVDDVKITDLVVDFNRTNQTAPASGDMACILMYDCDNPDISSIKAINVRQYAGRFLNSRNGRLQKLFCSDSYGDGWSLGTSGSSEFRLFGFDIDNIHAENCEGAYGGLEGNGVLVTTVNTRIGSLYSKDCHGGNKIQNTTIGTTIDVSEFDGDDQTFGSANSGTKVQGFNADSLFPTDVAISKVITRNAYGNGLVITAVNSCSVGEYHGSNNGSGSGATGSDRNDIEINTTDGTGAKLVQIGLIDVDTPDAIGVRHQGSGNVEILSITVRNPTGQAVQDASSGRLKIGHILAIDDQGSPTMTYALHVTSTVRGRVDLIETNLENVDGAPGPAQPRVLIATAANYSLEIGAIVTGSADPLEGVVQLTNASTTTAVACGHVFRNYVGGAADYFHPIIQVMPWDASARALSGQFGATVTDLSSATGFTLNHPSAGAADFVHWKILGWRVVSLPSA